LSGIEQLATDSCRLFQCPKAARVERKERYTPAVYNDPVLTARAMELFRELFGPERVLERPASMGGEDFGRYARELQIPGLLFRVGTQNEAEYRAGLQTGVDAPPGLHSSRYAPDPPLTLATALRATAQLALTLLQAH
jgi:hippurate hydrolase